MDAEYRVLGFEFAAVKGYEAAIHNSTIQYTLLPLLNRFFLLTHLTLLSTRIPSFLILNFLLHPFPRHLRFCPKILQNLPALFLQIPITHINLLYKLQRFLFFT